MKLEIYLDLDHTAIDTEGFKQWLADSVGQCGIPEKTFFEIYRRMRSQGVFTIPQFVDALAVDEPTRSRLMQALTACAKEVGRFLYPDVVPFLRAARERGARVILFTYGDRAFQELKLSGLTELTDLCAEVRVTEDRDKALPPAQEGTRVVVIDNRADVLVRYARQVSVVPVLLLRDRTDLESPALHQYRSLEEVDKMLMHQGLW